MPISSEGERQREKSSHGVRWLTLPFTSYRRKEEAATKATTRHIISIS